MSIWSRSTNIERDMRDMTEIILFLVNRTNLKSFVAHIKYANNFNILNKVGKLDETNTFNNTWA
jgi:hypothetical protein